MIEMAMCREIEMIARKMDAVFEALDAVLDAWLAHVDARFDAIISRLDGLIHQCKITIWMMVAVLILELVILALLVFDPVLR